ncbi:MAG: DUF6036 family nucleotidyltransferase [Caldilineaceae bacterium]
MSTILVNEQGITRFLQRLGRCYRYAGAVYLVGGSSLLLVAAKESTFDIDLKAEIAPEHHSEFVRCLRQVSRELQYAVEQASPDQFIPLPAGYLERCAFIGRFGMLDVFHFDFYSVALSKLHRGNEKDFNDVTNMLNQKIIEFAQLEQYFQEILPRYEDLLSADPDAYNAKFSFFKASYFRPS